MLNTLLGSCADGRQLLAEAGASLPDLIILNRDSCCLVRAHDAHQLLAARNRRVEQVSLKQFKMLGGEQQDDSRVLTALGLMDRTCISVG